MAKLRNAGLANQKSKHPFGLAHTLHLQQSTRMDSPPRTGFVDDCEFINLNFEIQASRPLQNLISPCYTFSSFEEKDISDNKRMLRNK